MKTILVLTDFSDNAAHAAEAALALAVKLSAGITLFHACPTLPVTPYYDTVPRFGDDPARWEADSTQRLSDLHDQLRQHCRRLSLPVPAIDLKTVQGDLGSNVAKFVAQKETVFIVMGARSDCAIDHFFNGSDTRSVIEHVHAPVLIIPSKAPLPAFKKLIMATDFNENELGAIRQLAQICKQLHAGLEVVHITLSGEIATDRETAFLQQLAKLKSPFISYREIRGREVVNRLNRICKQTGADVVSLVHHERTFFGRIFDHSITNKSLANQKVPLLVFPPGSIR